MDERNQNYDRNAGRFERDRGKRTGQGYRGQPGPGRGNQDYGPQGAEPYGSGRDSEGRDYTASGAFGDREYGGRHDNMRDADDPNQGWGRGAAQARRGGGHRGTSPKGWQRSDERLADDICERLTEDDDIDASEISVKCSGGNVTLTGSVPDRRMKHRAEDLVESCSGVNDIDNRLSVNRGSTTARGSESDTGNGQSPRGKQESRRN